LSEHLFLRPSARQIVCAFSPLIFPSGLLRSILLASRQSKIPVTAAALSARVRRLNQLALGVAREVQLVGQADIFIYVERREYLTALHRMCAGLEGARVVLAKARQRLGR
jgi:hypothetical protein